MHTNTQRNKQATLSDTHVAINPIQFINQPTGAFQQLCSSHQHHRDGCLIDREEEMMIAMSDDNWCVREILAVVSHGLLSS